jgi:hypothetical protein
MTNLTANSCFLKHPRKLYEMTDRPDLFGGSYWGAFRYHPEHFDRKADLMIENRNHFARHYGLVKPHGGYSIAHMFHMAFGRDADHVEVYNGHGGSIILLNSPYCGPRQRLLDAGMTIIPPVYHPQATSHIKEFESVKAARHWIRAWEKIPRDDIRIDRIFDQIVRNRLDVEGE